MAKEKKGWGDQNWVPLWITFNASTTELTQATGTSKVVEWKWSDTTLVEEEKPMPPATASNKNQIEIIIELRKTAKRLSAYVLSMNTYGEMPHALQASLAELKAEVEKTRTKKEVRLQALELVTREIEREMLNRKKWFSQANAYSDSIYKLAQQLHASENLPEGDDANILRAMIAVLKAHGKVR